jgi:Gpi18-like mannosyltransferase
LIYRLAKKQLKAELAILACAVYALNPAVYIDSTIWGQVDSFFTMLVVAALVLLMKRRLGLATVFFTASVLMKPQGVFFLPILLFELLKNRCESATPARN